jgi:peptidoglycan/LPS O-acetylase OafA/YrhL
MIGGRPLRLAVIGTVVVLVGFLVQIADVTLSDGARGLGRGLVLAAAVVVAAVFYQAWGSTRHHPARFHAATAGALLGGAFVAAAVFSKSSHTLVGSTPMIAAGAFALVAALLAAHPQTAKPGDRR